MMRLLGGNISTTLKQREMEQQVNRAWKYIKIARSRSWKCSVKFMRKVLYLI